MYTVHRSHGKKAFPHHSFYPISNSVGFPRKVFAGIPRINWLFNKTGTFFSMWTSVLGPWRTFDTEYANQTFGTRIGRINPSQLQNRTSKSRNYWRMFTARPIIIKMSSTLCALCHKVVVVTLFANPLGRPSDEIYAKWGGSTHHTPRAKPHYENQVHAIEISH